MKERPILFSGAMVRAILAGKKTQTRRVVGESRARGLMVHLRGNDFDPRQQHHVEAMLKLCPYGCVGDRLWVREGFAPRYFDSGAPAYRADWNGEAADLTPEPAWKPSIHMPRWACRILLNVTEVRVERLQDITEEDACAEGIVEVGPSVFDGGGPAMGREAFMRLWDSINGKRAPWASNPWVWVVSFKDASATAA